MGVQHEPFGNPSGGFTVRIDTYKVLRNNDQMLHLFRSKCRVEPEPTSAVPATLEDFLSYSTPTSLTRRQQWAYDGCAVIVH